jgi:hypothetical protein
MVKGIYDFLALPETQQYEYTWNHATFLLSRIVGAYGYHVYACHDFYIEITYNRSANILEGIRVFKNTAQLEPYLDNLRFPEEDAG